MSEQEIKQLKEEEQRQATKEAVKASPPKPEPRRRHGEKPGLFGPILLIGIGVYFLLVNTGAIDGTLHWDVLFSWWPLFFIFIGLNIIVKQLPGALGTLATGFIGITAVGTFGALLVLGTQTPILGDFVPEPAEIQQDMVAVPLERGTREADINIQLNSATFKIEALQDSNNLVQGVVYTAGGIDVDSNGRRVKIQPQNHFSLGFSGSPRYTAVHEWDLGLSPQVVHDLTLDLSSGRGRVDLSGLQLSNLDVDGSSGAMTLTLPDSGNYDMKYDVGSGAVWMTFPSRGQHEFEIEGGSGGVNILLPAQIEARVSVNSGSGSFTISEQFIEQDSRGKDKVYVTPNFDEGDPNYIDLTIDMGSGAISISPEASE
jgi:hypothetical protein